MSHSAIESRQIIKSVVRRLLLPRRSTHAVVPSIPPRPISSSIADITE